MLRNIFRSNGIQKHQKIFPQANISRFQSTYSEGPKGGGISKYIVPVAIGTVGAGVGIIGIAYTSTDARKNVELTVPGSSYLIDAVLGPIEKHKELPKIDQGLLKKKMEREKAKQEKSTKVTKLGKEDVAPETTSKSLSIPPIVPVQPIDAKQPKAVVEKPADEIVDLTQILENSIVLAQKKVTAALSAAEDAATAVDEHASKIYIAIDTDHDNEALYESAAKVGKEKKKMVKSAEDQLKMAKAEIESLQKQVELGKDNKLSSENKTLPIAEAALTELEFAIKKVNKVLDDALENSNAVNNYKDLVKKGWNKFSEEIRAIIPDSKMGEASNEITKEELFHLLIHSHRRVSSLQKTLAKQETVDRDKRESVVKLQLSKAAKLNEGGRLQSELENQRREIGLEHRHRLSQLKEDMEIELRTQLKRQAAAHSDHLADVVYAKEKELNRMWENKLLDDLQTESDKYHKSISLMKSQVGGVKDAIKSRAEIDEAAHAAHSLWMACESLSTALRIGKADAHTWEDKLQPLRERVNAIEKVTGKSDPLIEVVLGSLTEESLTRGVYTEDALKERFIKVDRICSKVALIGDNGASLLRYLLSYMQSLFLLNAFEQIPMSEMLNEDVDVEQLDTHDILARTKYCLSKDDLLQAVKYLNLLGGEPRNVASDWLKEAKQTLEAKQAADVLMSYAAAVGTKAL